LSSLPRKTAQPPLVAPRARTFTSTTGLLILQVAYPPSRQDGAYNRYCLADPTSCPPPALGIFEHPLAMGVWIKNNNAANQESTFDLSPKISP
jgi:hypothetical protein